MARTCRLSGASFSISDGEIVFLDKVSPVFGGKKIRIPLPSLCPEERQRRRLAFRNDRFLYKRPCGLSGKSVISQYPESAPFPVYDHHLWFGDAWEPLAYAREFDFGRSFFPQFAELLREVPRVSLIQQGVNENSEYTNRTSNNKNCYLIFSGNFNEDCYYSIHINNCKGCVDCYNVHRSELCYESIDSYDCYDCAWVEGCYSCKESRFLSQCVSCSNCFLCHNLHRKQYCILNKQLSAAEYFRQLEDFRLSSWSGMEELKERFEDLRPGIIVKQHFGMNNENVTGNYLDNCKNTFCSFECREVEDGRYLQAVTSAKDCMDFSHWGRGVELLYECHSVGYNCYRLIFCNECWDNNRDLIYCDLCMNSSNLFGCVGLRHKQYCILNKQCSKEEYERLVPKIIAQMSKTGEWGEFFPIELSTFPYNETVANDYFPLNAEQAQRNRWGWREEPQPEFVQEVDILPDDSKNAGEDLAQRTLSCVISGKQYRLAKEELRFYKQQNLPLPRKCPAQRHAERVAKRNPRRLWERCCAKTGQQIMTAYPPDRPEKVYSEKAYQEEFFS